MKPFAFLIGLTLLVAASDSFAAEPMGKAAATKVSIVDGQWRINGEVTYPDTKAEGLLMNVRMVNSTFEDTNDDTRPKGFDSEANTAAFLKVIPDYVAHGVRGFTLCLQGGHCGYEGPVNSAFRPDGSLRESYLNRVRKVIEACDKQGVVVILGCYYQRQDQILENEEAVPRASSTRPSGSKTADLRTSSWRLPMSLTIADSIIASSKAIRAKRS